jgi:hypothetical protein
VKGCEQLTNLLLTKGGSIEFTARNVTCCRQQQFILFAFHLEAGSRINNTSFSSLLMNGLNQLKCLSGKAFQPNVM